MSREYPARITHDRAHYRAHQVPGLLILIFHPDVTLSIDISDSFTESTRQYARSYCYDR